MEALKIFKEYSYETSILDDFQFYEKKQNNFSRVQQQQIQQPPQQQFYNNLPNPNMKISNIQNHNLQQNNQFNQQQNVMNEDFFQKMSMKDYGNLQNINTNFPNKNQNFQPGDFINN